MSKKILSLALVVVMLFSTLAISSSAALSGGQVGLKLVSDATVGMPAGTTVTLKIFYTFPESVDYSTYTHSLGNIALAFTDGFQIKSANVGTANCGKDALTIGASYTEVYKPDFTVNDLATQWTNISKKFTANDTAKGWDDAILLAPSYLSGGVYNAKTGFPIDPDCEVFSLSFVTTRTLTADDSFGIPEGTLNSLTKVQYYDTAAAKSVAYTTENIVMDEATTHATAAAKADVYKLADPRKHVNADGTSTVAAFFAFDAATIAPDFVSGTSQFITGITATITATSGGQTITVTPDAIKYVYDINKDGTVYGFRVIMKNVPADAVITVVPAVATTDNATYTVDTLNFNVADVTAY